MPWASASAPSAGRERPAHSDGRPERDARGHAEPVGQVLLADHDRDRERADNGGADQRDQGEGERYRREDEGGQQRAGERQADEQDRAAADAVRDPPAGHGPGGARGEHRGEGDVADRLRGVERGDEPHRHEGEQAEVDARAQRDDAGEPGEGAPAVVLHGVRPGLGGGRPAVAQPAQAARA